MSIHFHSFPFISIHVHSFQFISIHLSIHFHSIISSILMIRISTVSGSITIIKLVLLVVILLVALVLIVLLLFTLPIASEKDFV